MKALAACITALLLALSAVGGQAQTYYADITKGTLNIREGPGLDNAVIGSLYPGDEVESVESKDGWTHIKADIEAGGGWVKSEYLSTRYGVTGTYINHTGGRIRVRDSAGGKNVVRWVKAGKTVTVKSWAEDHKGNAWAFVGDGYVSGDCISPVDGEESEENQ